MKKYISRLNVNDQLGDRYLILSVLGSGGMGAVYLAEDMKLKGKRWAIKEAFKPHENTQQCIDEAEILLKLNHPHLPRIIDYIPPDIEGYSYLVIDYIEGHSLLEVFEQAQRNLSYERIISYSIQICDLLKYLHEQKPKPIIYRDLKPSNIMIDAQDHVRLIDFGIARNYQIGNESDTIPLGTIGFAAPEQYEQQQTDHRTDLYNLGAMMYFLLSKGHYYYVSQQRVSEYRADLPKGLEQILVQLLHTNPDERYQSAAEVKKRLEVYCIEEPRKIKYRTKSKVIDLGMKKKVIVAGSLYAGSGSTFLSVALARILDQSQISNAVIEHPAIEPELYYQLDGEVKMPTNYSFWNHYILDKPNGSDRKEWVSGRTSWYPLDPKSTGHKDWNHEKCYKLLYSIQNSMIIIDVADRWEDTSVQELCMDADEVIIVADAIPYKFNKELSHQRFDYAYLLQKNNKSVHFVANKALGSSSKRREWLQSFPWLPTCMIPNIDYEDVIHAIWRGELVQNKPQSLVQLKEAMNPLLTKILK